MKRRICQLWAIRVPVVLLMLLTQCKNDNVLSEEWIREWSSPSPVYRPLQIVHGAGIRDKAAYFKDSCGLGGVVCNVPFGENYLKSEEDWTVFREGVKSMVDSGLRVWIYDEDGYPSLGAGGRVLEADPSLEALEMVYDKESENPFSVRRCYEYTHACNNFYTARRYPNPLNPKATEKFIEMTHQAYWDHLGPELYGEVEAFFTDEPSMMAVNLGELPENVRENVRISDPLDLNKKNLPMVSWVEGLPEKYKAQYGEELTDLLPSLFTGDSERDKVVRQKFWSLLAGMNKSYYYDAIRTWSQNMREKNGGKGPVSSGHCLHEEYPAFHVPLDGNKLWITSGFDIPGLDQLNSDPSIWSGSSWMAPFFPGSSAFLTGKRRVMCEMSDFSQTMAGKGPVPLEEMEAATAWQMAFGVTDFTLYYTIHNGERYPYRNEAAYKAYCDFVGRVNSVVMEAAPVRNILLYYPIYDLQREYIPTAGKMSRSTQSELTKIVESSFRDLGSNLLKAQNQFVLVDYLTLEKADITDNRTIRTGSNHFSSIVFPRGVVFPPRVAEWVQKAKEKGVILVFADDFSETPSPGQLTRLVGHENPLVPSSPEIAFGKFTRGDREIFMMVNTGKEKYEGGLVLSGGKRYVVLDPHPGSVTEPHKVEGSRVKVELAPLQTKIIAVVR